MQASPPRLLLLKVGWYDGIVENEVKKEWNWIGSGVTRKWANDQLSVGKVLAPSRTCTYTSRATPT